MLTRHMIAEWRLWCVELALLGLFMVLCLPAIFMLTKGEGGLASDAVNFHLPQINEFRENPSSLLDYKATATTLPFYHFLMGVLARLFGVNEVANDSLGFRCVHFLLSGSGLVAFIHFLSRTVTLRTMVVLSLPLITSWYVVSGAIYFGTDGPGLSLVLILLTFAVVSCTRSASLSGLLFLIAVTRHLFLPFAAAAVIIRAWPISTFEGFMTRIVLILMPATVIVAVYVVHWGGLTPPGIVANLNPKGIFPYALLGHLAVAGLWGGTFCLLRVETMLTYLRQRSVLLCLAATGLAVFILWVLSPSGYSIDGGRFGAYIWSVAKLTTPGDHSVAVLLAALFGVWGIFLIGFDCHKRGLMPIEMVSLSIFLLTLMLTYASYQRYSEPLCVASFAIATSRAIGRDSVMWLKYVPLMLLSVMGVATCLFRMYARYA